MAVSRKNYPARISSKTRILETLKRIPVGSLISFICAFICLASCVAILKLSDQQPIDTWPTTKFPVQPSVLLSICTALANLAIRSMFDAGVTISWWRKAHRGSTVGELHRSWAYGTGLTSILEVGWHFNLIFLASIFVTVAAIDGPLLQRASRVTTQPFFGAKMVTVSLSPNTSMVDHPTGYSTGRASTVDMLSPKFLPVIQTYNTREPIALQYTGCNGTCTTELIAPGFDVQCTISTNDLAINQTQGGQTNILSFDFVHNGNLADPGLISLQTNMPTTETVNQSTIRKCQLRLSQIRYQVQLFNGTVRALAPEPGVNNTIRIERLSREETGSGRKSSTMGGLSLSAQRKWSGTAKLFTNGSPYQLITSGETPLTYLNSTSIKYAWIDPTDVFISGMRELLFRAAIAASNSSAGQTVLANEETRRAVYESKYEYLAAAIAVMLAAILATSINLFGWWQLDRAFSLGPFEVAKAFNAPFLKDASYLGTSEKCFKAIAGKDIQYGELADSNDAYISVAIGTGPGLGIGQDTELLSYQGTQRSVTVGMGPINSVLELKTGN